MSQRFVFLIDADANLNGHLVGELRGYGFRVEAATDSNELMQRKDDLPALIVLCIDPKRTGWAVCNRLRKSTTLKSTPLIITSAEATEKDFEDHKKLKTRAEEYLHKPFGVEALVEKIGGLIGLPEPPEQPLEIPMESEELAIEDDGSIIEEEAELYADGSSDANTQAINAASFADEIGEEEDRTRIGVMNVDGEVDMETEAAFAAIGMDGLEDSTSLTEEDDVKPLLPRMPPAKKAPVAEVPLDEGFGDDDDPFALPRQAGPTVPAPLPPAESQPIQTQHFGQEKSDPLDLGLEDVARQAAAEPVRVRTLSQPRIVTSATSPVAASASASAAASVPAPAAQASAGDTQAHDTGAAAVAELKRERDQLKRDLEELQKKLAAKPADAPPMLSGGGFSREREFLNLRETINKKEREVLDLKDAVDAKQRQILDGATKLRELERKLGDYEERSVATETELVTAKEKIEALAHDKERSVERERQVKGRLDDALKTINRYEQEIESWKQRHATDVGAAEEAYNEAVAAHQTEVQTLKKQHEQGIELLESDHADKMQKAVDAHGEDKALLVAKHEEERGQLVSEHTSALEQLKEASHNEREGLRLRFEEQIAGQTQQHDAEVQRLREEHASAVGQLKNEHAAGLAEKDQLHADEIAGLRARHTKDTKEAERRHQEEVAALHERHKGELQAADERRLGELAQKAEEHKGELEALATDHGEERQRMEQDHVTALHALDERRQSELREAAEAHAGELARTRQELEQKLADELKNARDQHMRKMQALEESHADLKAGMQQRHAQQIDELKKEHTETVAEYDAAIAQRDQLITDGHTRAGELETQLGEREEEGKKLNARIGELEQRLKTALEDLNAREATLNERAKRIADLEQESAGYQDQILKAYQRIKSDESIVSRAKKALAIALTLLDESAPDGGDEASS
jgi:CheY-like chemotaxis protein